MADVADVPTVAGQTGSEKTESEKTESTKAQVRALLDRLPGDVTLEQIQYHLGVYVKIIRSEERAEKEGWHPQSEFDRRLAKWLTK